MKVSNAGQKIKPQKGSPYSMWLQGGEELRIDCMENGIQVGAVPQLS